VCCRPKDLNACVCVQERLGCLEGAMAILAPKLQGQPQEYVSVLTQAMLQVLQVPPTVLAPRAPAAAAGSADAATPRPAPATLAAPACLCLLRPLLCPLPGTLTSCPCWANTAAAASLHYFALSTAAFTAPAVAIVASTAATAHVLMQIQPALPPKILSSSSSSSHSSSSSSIYHSTLTCHAQMASATCSWQPMAEPATFTAGQSMRSRPASWYAVLHAWRPDPAAGSQHLDKIRLKLESYGMGEGRRKGVLAIAKAAFNAEEYKRELDRLQLEMYNRTSNLNMALGAVKF
jgi:hypothetical protein